MTLNYSKLHFLIMFSTKGDNMAWHVVYGSSFSAVQCSGPHPGPAAPVCRGGSRVHSLDTTPWSRDKPYSPGQHSNNKEHQ